MKPITVAAAYRPGGFMEHSLARLTPSPLVETVLLVTPEGVRAKATGHQVLTVAAPLSSQETLAVIIDRTATDYLLLLTSPEPVVFEQDGLERMLAAARSTQAGLVYSDFYEAGEGDARVVHPLNDYQPGSVRDDFDFGKTLLFSVPALRRAVRDHGVIPGVTSAGLYDLRLKLSIDHAIHHVSEALYSVAARASDTGGQTMFAYVDPSNAPAQKEMEAVFTDYLRQIGAYLPPGRFLEVGQPAVPFPVEASVIIPVLNRKGTIPDAVRSALSQAADFSFNVIVVDNHSTDGTTDLLSALALENRAVHHLVPVRMDLGIGGCWNEALESAWCGRYAVQLDSDDLYSGPSTLQHMVDLLRTGGYAMAIGAYNIVDAALGPIPPGLVDHREWTDENGRNNALRVNGMGAPRGFDTALMRSIRFLNVSYGEDYAAALRISREYRIGRIFESLYLCRRWAGNTDAALSQEQTNRNNAFKDRIRTEEIVARQKLNRGG